MHPRWLLPLLEIALLVVLTAINPVRLSRQTRVGRYLSMGLAGLITLDNVVSASVLDYGILTGKRATTRWVCSAPAPRST